MMPSTPSISQRKHYREPPSSPTEPTSTIVLTSHKAYYIDIRILKSAHQAESTKDLSLTSNSPDILQWAFAGTSSSTPESSDKPRHTVWEHWIDSKSLEQGKGKADGEVEGETDEGDMFPLPNGDVLEKGNTTDTATGVETAYEELWTDLPVDVIPEEGGKYSTVLLADTAAARGMEGKDGDGLQPQTTSMPGLTRPLPKPPIYYLAATTTSMPCITRPPPRPPNPLTSDHVPPILTPITRPPAAHPPPPPSNSASLAMAPAVRYIPPQMDPLSSTTTEAARKSPLRLFIKDARVLCAMLPYLPWLFLPFWTSDPRAELYVSVTNLREMALQVVLFVVEVVMLALVVPAFLMLPGAGFVLLVVMVGGLVWGLTRPMEGPTVVYSRMDDKTVERVRRFEDERWVFVNGCTVGHKGLQANVDLISATFGRPVIGIHNTTYGLPFDILECLIQRDFAYNTLDVRVAYDYVKACLCDPTVRKVILIGHSQGGIIISMVIDELLKDLPQEVFGKVEIYTFGSAASHFNNPLVSFPNGFQDYPASSEKEKGKRCISHIEHYCNEYDMVSRWGALYNVASVLDNRYSGTVFVRMGATGHMFNQHYLTAMFPQPIGAVLSTVANGHGMAATGAEQRVNVFLDKPVAASQKLALAKEDIAMQKMGLMRRESTSPFFEFGNGEVVPVGAVLDGDLSKGSKGDTHIKFLEDDVALGGQGVNGKTVRQLSRLWKYEGGRSPEG
ncbi:hypothetical protein G7Y79_00041g077820 [Physcia stellaris]|nr:hypothetical protein G7Y79_00041g077820 [Physcia stellaris]